MYELAVWIKMFQLTFSYNCGKGVQLVYSRAANLPIISL